MNFKKFDIIIVDFPFSNLSQTKRRPVLVIKDAGGNNIILCQITTKRRNIQKYEIILNKESCNGDIRFNSFIYVDMIFTLHNNLIHRQIGEVSNQKLKDEINLKLKEILNDD